jgi:hypothetical protein
MRPGTKFIAAVAAMQIAAVLTLPSVAAPIKVEGGLVEGTVEQGITVYKGIPFAAPPTGNLRWRPPQPVKSWDGVLKAAHYAPACPQIPLEIPIFPKVETSEDCLYLNVWTPAQSPAENLPVMVWIYGGAFALSATSIQDRSRKGFRLLLRSKAAPFPALGPFQIQWRPPRLRDAVCLPAPRPESRGTIYRRGQEALGNHGDLLDELRQERKSQQRGLAPVASLQRP